MKKLLSVILAVSLICGIIGTFGVMSYAETSGDFTYTLSNGVATITAYNGSGVDLVIPAELNGYPVTRIAVQAFRYNKTIKSIYISDSITTIDSYAFRDCTALESVRLPETLTRLNTYTFYGCSKLNNVVVPASVTSIDNYALGNCKALKTVTIMGESTTIANNAFYLTNLETAYIHENSPADSFNFPSGTEKRYLEDVDPVVARNGAQVKMKSNSATTVEDGFQLRITSVISDADWDFNFSNTGNDDAIYKKITSVGLVAYRGAAADFNEATAKAVVNDGLRDSDYAAATTDYISKSGDNAAYFGAIVKVKHSTLANDIIYLGFVNYLDVNGTARTVFYETSYTAPIVSNYDTIVSNYLARYPYTA